MAGPSDPERLVTRTEGRRIDAYQLLYWALVGVVLWVLLIAGVVTMWRAARTSDVAGGFIAFAVVVLVMAPFAIRGDRD